MEMEKTLETLKAYQEAYIELLISYNEHLKWTVEFLADLTKAQNAAFIKRSIQNE